jgi:methylenetetrahydrofolate reductase (NADPH)
VKELKSGSKLEKLLAQGEFVVTSELGPPKSIDRQLLDEKVGILKSSVDAVNITDNQSSVVRISSIGTACYIMQKGLEPIIQMTCRDRNRLALQADLLGACLNGIQNLLCITGDHQSFGNHPQAKQVFDLDSIQLVKMIKDMRDQKIFQCGEEIRNNKKSDIFEPRIFVGAAANPFADPMDWRIIRLEKKIAAGVDFIQTQCVYDMDRFSEWMAEVVQKGLHEKVKILAGVTPIRSLGMLKYMRKNVAGISIPDSLMERISKADDAQKEGLKFCCEQIEQFKKTEGLAGVHIMAIEWESAVPGIVKDAGLLPRPKAA